MALDVTKFATVARAEKSVHLYNYTDAYATVTAANYFANKAITASIEEGDTIIAVCSDGVFILNVTAINKVVGTTYTCTTALSKASLAVKVANQAASVATTVAGLVTDFNSLLTKLKAVGVMTAD